MSGEKIDGPADKPVALEVRSDAEDGRRFSPSAARNRDVIRDVWHTYMPRSGTVLEIASGTGEHGVHIASSFPDVRWQHSDIDALSLDSQKAWSDHFGAPDRLPPPIRIDVTEPGWAAPHPPDAIYCANMIHIAPFAAARGLIAGAGRLLSSGGKLMLYGPFARAGDIAPSNAAFSESLKTRHPDWGVRDLDAEIVPLAEAAGLDLETVVEMPANNLSVIFTRT